MGCLGCRVFVAFLLKFLNFIQAFIGASMILYAVWMLNHWNSHVRPPPISPAPNNVDGYNLPAELMSLHSSVGQQLDVPFSNPQTISRADQTQFRKLGQHSFGIVAGADLDAASLPAPWFIYTFLGIGIIVCVITCIGHVAAEITNGFCLCCVSCVFNLCGIFSSWCILKKLVSAPKIRKHLLLNKSFIFYRLSLKIFLFILL